MNIKHVLASSAALAFAALAVPAAAQSATDTTDTTDTTCATSCTGSGDMTLTNVQVGGEGLFAGFGEVTFDGETGYGIVEKSGYANIDVSAAINGLCTDCSTTEALISGSAGEHVMSAGGAMSETPGSTVMVANQGGAAAMVNLQGGFTQWSGPVAVTTDD